MKEEDKILQERHDCIEARTFEGKTYWSSEDFFCPQCGHHDSHYANFRQPGDPLVTVIGFWPIEEKNQLGYDNAWISRCHYRTACAHAHWNVQIIENPEQARVPKGPKVVCLEEPYKIQQMDIMGQGYSSSELPQHQITLLEDFEHPEDVTYIMGNTFFQRPSDHFKYDYLVGMEMDDPEIAAYSPLYGNQLATILWWDRKLKNAKKGTTKCQRIPQEQAPEEVQLEASTKEE